MTNGSRVEAMAGAQISSFEFSGRLASTSAAAEDPEAFAISTFAGGTLNEARPLASVVTRSPPPISTVTSEANFPSTPSTASVAGLPATTLDGSTIVTVHLFDGDDCGRAGGASATSNPIVRSSPHRKRRNRGVRSESGWKWNGYAGIRSIAATQYSESPHLAQRRGATRRAAPRT